MIARPLHRSTASRLKSKDVSTAHKAALAAGSLLLPVGMHCLAVHACVKCALRTNLRQQQQQESISCSSSSRMCPTNRLTQLRLVLNQHSAVLVQGAMPAAAVLNCIFWQS
jgi:hypothetical protein